MKETLETKEDFVGSRFHSKYMGNDLKNANFVTLLVIERSDLNLHGFFIFIYLYVESSFLP